MSSMTPQRMSCLEVIKSSPQTKELHFVVIIKNIIENYKWSLVSTPDYQSMSITTHQQRGNNIALYWQVNIGVVRYLYPL